MIMMILAELLYEVLPWRGMVCRVLYKWGACPGCKGALMATKQQLKSQLDSLRSENQRLEELVDDLRTENP